MGYISLLRLWIGVALVAMGYSISTALLNSVFTKLLDESEQVNIKNSLNPIGSDDGLAIIRSCSRENLRPKFYVSRCILFSIHRSINHANCLPHHQKTNGRKNHEIRLINKKHQQPRTQHKY